MDLRLGAGQPQRPATPPQSAGPQEARCFVLQKTAGIGERNHLSGKRIGRNAPVLVADRGDERLGPRRDEVAQSADDLQAHPDGRLPPIRLGLARPMQLASSRLRLRERVHFRRDCHARQLSFRGS